MKYVLDTDTLIYFLKGNENILSRMSRVPSYHIFTTIINHAELFFGAFNSIKKKFNLEKIQEFLATIKIMPFCEEASIIFAENKAKLKQRGNIIADLDLIIASIAMKNNAVLVTNNTKHFIRIKELHLDNWT
jgi:tRNA(fMet)-specific endonuclease VapC